MPGRIVAIHVAPESGAPMEPAREVEARADFGLAGDRCARSGSRGQVTLVTVEDLHAAAAELGSDIGPGATRRNVTLEGLALPPKGGRVLLGDVLLEVTGPADPCRLMDEVIAPGARQALEGRAGVRARVLAGGLLKVGGPAVLQGEPETSVSAEAAS